MIESVEREAMIKRKHLLAAEPFNYSYANYANHLGNVNIRFEKLMPETFDVLERGIREGWNN
jgi:hypothetical protein